MAWTVSQVAKAAGVSVRTLHHYDEIGLVRAGGRSEGNYRIYERADLERLQEVLFFRELGFALDEIGRILDDPQFDRRAALELQRRLLRERAARTTALMKAVDTALEAQTKGREMPKEELFEVFGDFKPEQHEAEAQQRWGQSAEFKESQRRTKRYTKQDWARMKIEAAAITEELAALAATGHAPEDDECKAVAEKARQHICKWFYNCTYEIHRALGEMYVADERFAQNYERVRPGLAMFLRDAIVANAEGPYVQKVEKAPEKVKQFVKRRR